jgi:hypothetical protein
MTSISFKLHDQDFPGKHIIIGRDGESVQKWKGCVECVDSFSWDKYGAEANIYYRRLEMNFNTNFT